MSLLQYIRWFEFFSLIMISIFSLLCSNAYAANTDITIVTDSNGKSFGDVISFHEDAREQDAILIFKEAPGKDDLFVENITALNTAEGALSLDDLMTEEISLINRSLYGENAETASAQQITHAGNYCSSDSSVESAAFEGCPEDVSKKNQHGEIKVSSILGEMGYPIADQERFSTFVKTFTNPIPKESAKAIVSSADELGKPSNIEKLIKLRSGEAKLSAATNSLFHAIRIRTQAKTEGESIAGLSTEGETARSVMEVLQEEATRRLKDTDWPTRVAEASGESLLRELVHMEAIRLKLDFLKYQQGERIEFLLAAMVSSTAQSAGSTSEAIGIATDF